MKLIYAKTALYAYPYLKSLIKQYNDLVMEKALKSFRNPGHADEQCEVIADLQIQKQDLVDLKAAIDVALSEFTPKDIRHFQYKFFKQQKEADFRWEYPRSRKYFREQEMLINKFAWEMTKAGITDDWFEEALKISALAGFYRKAKDREEAIQSSANARVTNVFVVAEA